MTTTEAGAELDVTSDRAGLLYREGLIRGKHTERKIDGRTYHVLALNGQDVQRLVEIKRRWGARRGLALVRELGLAVAYRRKGWDS